MSFQLVRRTWRIDQQSPVAGDKCVAGGRAWRAQNAWGNFKDPKIYSLLNKALGETNYAKRVALYQQANNEIMTFLPGVPYAHSSPAIAFKKGVSGYVPSPVDIQYFSSVSVK